MENICSIAVNYNTPDFIKKLMKSIPASELYEDKSVSCPESDEISVTIASGIPAETKLWKLKLMLMPLHEYRVKLGETSVINAGQYDILKCDVISEALLTTNNVICKTFKREKSNTEYRPCAVIAIMKKGEAAKYAGLSMKEDGILTPACFSWIDKTNAETKEQKWC